MTAAAQQSGRTLVETTMSLVLMTAVLIIAYRMVTVGRSGHQRLETTLDLGESMRAVSFRMREDLRPATRTGEDTNGNGLLDSGEDLNGNGVLEADWSIGPASITFNKVLPDGTVSAPTTYRLAGRQLQRVQTVLSGTGTSTVVTVLDRSAAAFAVADDGARIDCTLTLERPDATGNTTTRSETITVIPRN